MSASNPARRQPEPPLKPYIVFGLIAAARLPDRLQLGDEVLLVRLPGSDPLLTRELPILGHPDIQEPHWSAIPGHIRIKSQWSISFRVDSGDEEDAYRIVNERRLPSILAALTAINESAVSIVLTRVGIETQDGHVPHPHTPWSPSGLFRLLHGGVTTAEQNRELAIYESTARTDADCLTVCQYFAVATQMDELSAARAPFVAATLLRYFQCIELVSQKTVRRVPADDETLSPVLLRVRTALNGTGSNVAKARVIQNAAVDLNRVQNGFMSQKIRLAGEELRVSEDSIKAAEHLCQLRNTQLGHPTSDSGDFTGEGEPAAKAAREYMVAFLRSRSRF